MKSTIVFLMAVVFGCAQARADQWDYRVATDKMTGKASNFASITSNNSLSLEAPYSGPNYGRLIVRKHAQHGLDVLVSITKGQILCPSYSGCSVKVRFGDGQPMTFSANGPEDLSSTTVFLRNAQKFIDQTKKTKSIKIQMNIYQAGGQVLEFESPIPLVWGQTQGKKPQP